MPGVLVVCTANVCRSPAVSELLRAALGPTVPVSSAGTQARPGAPACPISSGWIGRAPQDHGARPITTQLLRDAALVLVFTAHQRADVLRVAPAVQRRCLTLLQAARVADWITRGRPPAPSAAGGDRLRTLADELDAARGSAPPPQQVGDDDLADPHRYGEPEHRAALERADLAVQSIARAWTWVGGVSPADAVRSRGW